MIKKKKIVQKAPRHVRKPAMYLNVNRFCGDCGSNKTSFTAINHVQWHRDIDEQGKWTGKYLCNTCYNRKRLKKHDEEIALMRQKFVEERNSKRLREQEMMSRYVGDKNGKLSDPEEIDEKWKDYSMQKLAEKIHREVDKEEKKMSKT